MILGGGGGFEGKHDGYLVFDKRKTAFLGFFKVKRHPDVVTLKRRDFGVFLMSDGHISGGVFGSNFCENLRKNDVRRRGNVCQGGFNSPPKPPSDVPAP